MSQVSKIKFAIAGCGRIAQRHAEHIARVGELTAVCDIVKSKADALASLYKAETFPDVEDMLRSADADVVAVCTPNGLHAMHSIRALEKGFHVLCEKPMALTSEDCRRMINTASDTGKQLFIVKQNRFNPPVAAVKKVVDEERLGKILSVQLNCFWNRDTEYYRNSWKGTRDLDGGTLFTQFSHFIDLLYWMVGDIVEVKGYSGNLDHPGVIEFEDTGVLAIRFAGGAIGTINYTVNSFQKNMEGSITLFGERGTVKIGGQYLNELEYQNIENYKITDLPPGNPANNYGQYQGSMSNHDKVYKNVIDVLNGHDVIATSGYDGLKTVEIIEKIYSNSTRI
ncbi:MAG TPA: Gfo/Idh/MocA family oxidoreductase [Puia sp.]|nr:Gfo/Idh/MocA family oxidoreductase [Puia sp.]